MGGSWTLEAVQYAAHTSRMTVVMQQLARAHGENVGAAMQWGLGREENRFLDPGCATHR